MINPIDYVFHQNDDSTWKFRIIKQLAELRATHEPNY